VNRPPHIAVVTQNADLVSDLRPRAEAEALARAGFRVTLVGPTAEPGRVREITAPEVAIELFPLPQAARSAAGQIIEQCTTLARSAATLARLCRRAHIDAIHAANPPDDLWLLVDVVRAFQRSRPRFVFDQHDVAPVLIVEKYGSQRLAIRALHALAETFERASFRRAALVVFANPRYRERAAQSRLLRGPHVVVPNGWALTTQESREQPTCPIVAYVGTMNEQDCVPHLVDAVAASGAADRIRAVMAGDGSARAQAESRAEELGIAASFDWLGWVSDRSAIASLVHSADVCVAPETDSEFNRLASLVKIGEYMSAGAAIAAHPLAQTVEVAGPTIEYAEDMSAESLGAAIRLLLDDRDRASRLGAAARARFEANLRWETAGAPCLVAAYRKLFPGGDPGAQVGLR
jgi:glycosyltransferase involved in cell wall biosynthesis